MQLIPMTEREYTLYFSQLISNYAAEHVRARHWTADEAKEQALMRINAILPEGMQTPHHYFYILHIDIDEEDAAVGLVWLGIIQYSIQPRAFIYDIMIYENYRCRGYATQALRAIEDKARELELDTIALHVFGHNHEARALYEKNGYIVTDLMMSKKL